MDAEILAVTLRNKNTMSKRRALRLLLSAPRGDYLSEYQPEGSTGRLTQNEALGFLFEDVLANDGTNVNQGQNNDIRDVIGIGDESEIRDDENDF